MGKKMSEHLPFVLWLGGTIFALGLMKAAEIIEDGRIDSFIENRYSSYKNTEIGKKIMSEDATLEEIAQYACDKGECALPGSGKQEGL